MTPGSVIGFDLGGTKSAIGRFDNQTFEQQAYERFFTNAEQGFEKVIQDMVERISQIRTPETKAVGIGIPGLLKQPEGYLMNAPNLPGSHNFEIKKILEEALKLPVAVDNDANAFALSEAMLGSGKGHKVIVGITLGTGVGGGIIIDQKIFHGAMGSAAEIGHMLLIPGKPPYLTADARGEVEQFISGTALGRRCREAKRPEDYLDGEVCSFMHPDFFREVAWLCLNLTYLLNPSIIIFGGSTGKALEPHLPSVRKDMQEWAIPNAPLPELAMQTLEHPGTLGAALLTTL
ncbi:MAG: hypothetical protein JWM56_245 [Candidatus Peribacteria bacterium]|nr:hypothetical protein [Candidatus Peribacteria bacterium]